MTKQLFFKYAKNFLLFLIPVAVVISGCAKDEDEPEEENPTTPAATPKFTWTLGGGTLVTADDSYFVSEFSNIYASRTNGMSVDINLSDLNTGNHIIAPSNGVTLEYASSSGTLNATSGSVVISENTGTSVSGTFTCNLSGSGVNSTIKGDFSKVPKK